MNPIFLPSLQHMASVTISVHIYCNEEIQTIHRMMNHPSHIPLNIHERDRHTTYKGWERIKEVTMNILPAEIPKSLKTRLADYIRPIQQTMNVWLIDHPYVHIFTSGCSYLHYISWKSEGTIDRLQTAKNMLRNPDFSSVGRFLMACTYFLEEDILNLWGKMEDASLSRRDRNLVIRFWIKWLNRKDKIHWSQMFCEHFINPKIKPWERTIRVTRIFDFLPQESRSCYLTMIRRLGHKDDIRLCLYQLDEQQRIQLMKSDPHGILISYLRWPFQTLFMEMANQLWGYLTLDYFHDTLMYFLLYYIFTSLEYFDYLELFREFWHSSPAFFREVIEVDDEFQVIEAILNYDKDSCCISVEDAEKYYHCLF